MEGEAKKEFLVREPWLFYVKSRTSPAVPSGKRRSAVGGNQGFQCGAG